MDHRFARRTALFAVSASLLALGALPARAEAPAVLAPASTSAATPATGAPAVTDTDPAGRWGRFGVQTQWLDPTVKPGSDFNAYVNGKWIAQTEIPADRARYGSFDQLGELSESRLHTILDELVAANPAPGTAEARVAAAYKAFTDTAAIDAAGLTPAQPYLRRIQAVKSRDQLVDLFAQPGFDSPISAGVDTDAKDSSTYLMAVSQAGLGLPDRDYYLVDNPRFVEIRKQYVDYTAFLLGKAGYSDPAKTAQSVLALETAMARAMWDRTISRNRNLTYNKLTPAEIGALPQGSLLTGFLAALKTPPITQVDVAQIPPTAAELAADKITPEMQAKLGGGIPATLRLIADAPLADWQAWLSARFLASHAGMLPRDIDAANFAFYGTVLNGQPQQRERWKRGIATVEGQVGELLGQIYAARYFPAANKAAMDDLVANLRKAMAANLVDLKWMGPDTRGRAQAKLDAFTPKIGAPDTYKTYDELAISPTDPLGNSIAAARWSQNYDNAKLGRPVDRSEWYMLPETINAYYNWNFNEIVFPAGILQPPFFNVTADPAVNYGAIGAVIGHEMGHGFDDQGAKSDGAGNMTDWWTTEDKARFEALQDKLAAQYNAFCPFDDGKTCVNGRLTMGENIGDLGGLSVAYRAYHMSLNGKPAPVIGGYTGDQRFFMGFAQVWRNKSREEMARQLLLSDPHSPPQYRINGIVRNFDEWYKAFDVKPGDALYLPPEQRVRIW